MRTRSFAVVVSIVAISGALTFTSGDVPINLRPGPLGGGVTLLPNGWKIAGMKTTRTRRLLKWYGRSAAIVIRDEWCEAEVGYPMSKRCAPPVATGSQSMTIAVIK